MSDLVRKLAGGMFLNELCRFGVNHNQRKCPYQDVHDEIERLQSRLISYQDALKSLAATYGFYVKDKFDGGTWLRDALECCTDEIDEETREFLRALGYTED